MISFSFERILDKEMSEDYTRTEFILNTALTLKELFPNMPNDKIKKQTLERWKEYKNSLKTKSDSSSSSSNSEVKEKVKKPREPTIYNVYMAEEIGKLKTLDPNLKHTEAFKLAAANWGSSNKNPKKKD